MESLNSNLHKNLLLNGDKGTGKTYILLKYAILNNSKINFIEIHEMSNLELRNRELWKSLPGKLKWFFIIRNYQILISSKFFWIFLIPVIIGVITYGVSLFLGFDVKNFNEVDLAIFISLSMIILLVFLYFLICYFCNKKGVIDKIDKSKKNNKILVFSELNLFLSSNELIQNGNEKLWFLYNTFKIMKNYKIIFEYTQNKDDGLFKEMVNKIDAKTIFVKSDSSINKEILEKEGIELFLTEKDEKLLQMEELLIGIGSNFKYISTFAKKEAYKIFFEKWFSEKSDDLFIFIWGNFNDFSIEYEEIKNLSEHETITENDNFIKEVLRQLDQFNESIKSIKNIDFNYRNKDLAKSRLYIAKGYKLNSFDEKLEIYVDKIFSNIPPRDLENLITIYKQKSSCDNKINFIDFIILNIAQIKHYEIFKHIISERHNYAYIAQKIFKNDYEHITFYERNSKPDEKEFIIQFGTGVNWELEIIFARFYNSFKQIEYMKGGPFHLYRFLRNEINRENIFEGEKDFDKYFN